VTIATVMMTSMVAAPLMAIVTSIQSLQLS
jgi:hypothetical protein